MDTQQRDSARADHASQFREPCVLETLVEMREHAVVENEIERVVVELEWRVGVGRRGGRKPQEGSGPPHPPPAPRHPQHTPPSPRNHPTPPHQHPTPHPPPATP